MLLNHSMKDSSTGLACMCITGAQRFNESCTIMLIKKQLKGTQGKAHPQIKNRCAMLFGTCQVRKGSVDQAARFEIRCHSGLPSRVMRVCK